MKNLTRQGGFYRGRLFGPLVGGGAAGSRPSNFKSTSIHSLLSDCPAIEASSIGAEGEDLEGLGRFEARAEQASIAG
jgi:hypothetical protein